MSSILLSSHFRGDQMCRLGAQQMATESRASACAAMSHRELLTVFLRRPKREDVCFA